MIKEHKNCRICQTPLRLVMDLGETPLANNFVAPGDEIEGCATYPLRLAICPTCSLGQLMHVVDPMVLYSNYAYITSTSKTMDEHLSLQKSELLSFFEDKPRVLEIASNTGIYLKKFKDAGCEVLGIEPAMNIVDVARNNGITTACKFFNLRTAYEIAANWGKADLIIGRHVLAHIDDLHEWIQALDVVASDRVVIAFEVPYLKCMFTGVQFDTIYHEHLSYFTIRSMEQLLERSPFRLEAYSNYRIHGGSIMFFIRRKDAAYSNQCRKRVYNEVAELELCKPDTWKEFNFKVQCIQHALKDIVTEQRVKGCRVAAYGASAKGNTLLYTCRLDFHDIDFVVDNTPFKQFKLTPGSNILIKPPSELLAQQPDYCLILAWNFAKEIIANEQEYQKRGGRFIVPIPYPEVIPYADISSATDTAQA